ncbi:MAG: hypothetical protein R3C11_03615 [Planctomycetaceae bacterium]
MLKRISLFSFLFIFAAGIIAVADDEINSPEHQQDLEIAREVLREASELLCDPPAQVEILFRIYLEDIVKYQLQLEDLEGLRISCSYPCWNEYKQKMHRRDLASLLAKLGQLEEARKLLEGHEWSDKQEEKNMQDYLDLCEIDQLISLGKLDEAENIAVNRMYFRDNAQTAYLKLAVGFARAGQAEKRDKYFRWSRFHVDNILHWEYIKIHDRTARAQIEVGDLEGARKTVETLYMKARRDSIGYMKMMYYFKLAELTQLLDLPSTSEYMLEIAFNCEPEVLPRHYSDTRHTLLEKHLEYNHLDEVVKRIPTSQNQDGNVLKIVYLLLSQDHVDAATEVITKYRNIQGDDRQDEAHQYLVDFWAKKQNPENALAAAEKIKSDKLKAISQLKAATAFAQSDKSKRAIEIATSIDLDLDRGIIASEFGSEPYDFRDPSTWLYRDFSTIAGTGLSMTYNSMVSDVIASNSLILAESLQPKPEYDYAVIFKKSGGDTIRTLARAHVVSGNLESAINWSRRIGTSDPASVTPRRYSEDMLTRAMALLGCAEGIMERAGLIEHPRLRYYW